MDKRSSYSAGFKLKVIDFAEKHGNRAAGREFTVTEFNVRYWRKQKLALQNTNKLRRAFRGPKCGKFPAMEDELFEYVLGLRKDGCCVSHEMLHLKARELATKRGISRTDLKVSQGWITRFMKRKSLSLRRRTSLSQRVRKDFEDKVMDVIQLRKSNSYMLSQILIANADQTPLNFDMLHQTITEKASAEVNKVKEEQDEQPIAKKKRGGGKSQEESREVLSDEEDNKESGEVNSVKEEQEEQLVAKKKQGAEKSQKVRRKAPSDEEDNTAEH